MRSKRDLSPQEREELQFQVLELFLAEETMNDIAAHVRRHFGVPFSREEGYLEMRRAVSRGYLALMPPYHRELAKTIDERFPNNGDLRVVRSGATAENTPRYVAERGAELVMNLLLRHAERRRLQGGSEEEVAVHVALGVGKTSQHFARSLGARLRHDPDAPPLVLHALTAPHAFWSPLESPIASFNHFRDAFRPVRDHYAPFCAPSVPAGEYARTRSDPGVTRALKAAGEIDVLVLSLAALDCNHGTLLKFLREFEHDATRIDDLKKAGWVGDVQLRPFADDGPLDPAEHMGRVPVTLFELPDLTRFARSGEKDVVLLCGPCSKCGASKARALLPLLIRRNLHLWNHLVVDARTAQEVAGWEPS